MLGEVLAATAREVAALVVFRGLPIVAAALFGRELSLRAKVLLAGGSAAALFGPWRVHPALGGLAFAYAYLVLCCCAMPALTRALRDARLTSGGAFVACAALFLILPALVWPVGARASALVIGWDLMLAGYSYAIEQARSARPSTLRECLFFLLVDPVLVYPQRSGRVAAAGFSLGGCARAARASCVLVAATALLAPLHAAVREAAAASDTATWPVWTHGALWVVGGALRLLLEYARQSGLAGLQIGLMRQLGYVAPERYLRPLAARSLPDFWRRWNTYVGQWLLRYVFSPVSLRVGRHVQTRGGAERRRRWGRLLGPATGVLATFVSIGLLHDAYFYGLTFGLEGDMLQAFAANGLLVLVSLALGQLVHRSAGAERPAWLSLASRMSARLSFWVAAVASCALWWP